MVPEKNRPEWKDLVKGDCPYTFANFVFQLKLNRTIADTNEGRISVDRAVEELYELCVKYEKAVKPDLDKIFNSHEV